MKVVGKSVARETRFLVIALAMVGAYVAGSAHRTCWDLLMLLVEAPK